MKLVNQIAEQRILLEDIVTQALELAHSTTDAAEVSINKTIGITVSTRYGMVENLEFNNDGNFWITVYRNQRKGVASSKEFSKDAIKHTVTSAIDIARYTSFDSASGPADKDLLAYQAPDLDLFHPSELNIESSIALAAAAENTALNSDKRITHTEEGRFSSHCNAFVFGSSYGMLQGYNSSRHALSCSVIAENNGNMERDYAYTLARSFNDLRSPQWVGEECARRALSRLNPRKLSTTSAPVLFTAEIATSLFKHLAKAISGNNVYRKSTFLIDSLDKMILPNWLSIQERPHLIKGLASSPFDGEGVKTSNRIIVNNGVLSTWLLDSYSARKLGLKSTGHAGGIYNWCISHQTLSFIDLLKKMNRGLVVTELMGEGANIITGDYSRGAAGFWIENGEIQFPVSEITIASNLKDMFYNIVSIGSDIEKRSCIQCGSVLISNMKIAGQ